MLVGLTSHANGYYCDLAQKLPAKDGQQPCICRYVVCSLATASPEDVVDTDEGREDDNPDDVKQGSNCVRQRHDIRRKVPF